MVKGEKNGRQKDRLKYEFDTNSFPIKINRIACEIKKDVPSEKGTLLGILEQLKEMMLFLQTIYI